MLHRIVLDCVLHAGGHHVATGFDGKNVLLEMTLKYNTYIALIELEEYIDNKNLAREFMLNYVQCCGSCRCSNCFIIFLTL